jgi:hypothetical protein
MADPLSNLGQVLMGAAQDYASNKRQDDREARLRQERLADVAEARAYDSTVRADQQDFQRIMQDRSVQNDIKLQLIHEGLLSPGNINNPAAIEKAFFEAQRRGLDVLYRDLFSTPGEDGKPLLNRADLSDPAKIEAAKQKLAEVKAGVTAFSMDQPKLAQKESTRLVGEAGKIQARLADLERQLSEPQPQPDANQVTKQAIQNLRAQKKNPKYMPSQAEIEAEAANVVPQLQQRLDQQWFQNKEDARLQYPILSAQLQNLRAEQSSITSKFGVAPTAPAAVSTPTAQPMASRGVANPQQQAEALAAVIRGAAPPHAPQQPAPANIAETGGVLGNLADISGRALDAMTPDAQISKIRTPNPLQASVTRDSLKRFLVGGPSSLDTPTPLQHPAGQSPLNAVLQDIRLVDQQLAAAGPSAPPELRQRKAALETEAQRLQSALLGPTSGVTPPQTNTSGFVQPQFNAPAPFAPSNLLEPAY